MFAVKGWSVDASALKAQVAPVKDGEKPSKEAAQKERKRKRGIGGPAEEVKEDVGALWEQHVEGKKPVKTKDAGQKGKKRRKVEGKSEAKVNSEEASNGVKEAEAPVVEKSSEAVARNPKTEKRNKKKKEKEKRTKAGEAGQKSDEAAVPSRSVAKAAPPPVPPLPAATKLTPMQAAMRQKLVSARFRHLNQTLYTAPSATALELFDQNPEMFEDYHAGFRQQVDVWPENPLDNFIATIQARGKVKPPAFKDKKGKKQHEATTEPTSGVQALPRTHGTAIIADLGCGDARLAQTLQDNGDTSKLNLKLHSYDLHAPSPLVTKADISALPLADNSADVAIFCLALMGTNWIAFIEEAYRILHWKGELWVAEIKSRFGRVGRAGKPVEHSVGGRKKQAASQKAQATKHKEAEEVDEQTALRTAVDGVEVKQEETDVSAFVNVLRRRGFVLKVGDKSVDLSNKMFVKMEFIKAAAPTKGKSAVEVSEQRAKIGQQGKKFVEKAAREEEISTEDEAKVLKPCLYKIR